MAFGKTKTAEGTMEDPRAWMVESPVAEFLLMHTNEIKYMCMLGYAFVAGNKAFLAAPADASAAYKFVLLILYCTGGGILVPIFLNKIPVALAQDAYPIAIACSFILHSFFPVLRDVLKRSSIFKIALIVMFETVRAYVVCTFTNAGAQTIAPSQFAFPVFGPIMCGAVGGCGAAFMPVSKGLDPLKKGLQPPMISALVAAAGYHIFLNTSLSEGCVDAQKKAQFHVAVFFILVGMTTAFGFGAKVEAPKKKVA